MCDEIAAKLLRGLRGALSLSALALSAFLRGLGGVLVGGKRYGASQQGQAKHHGHDLLHSVFLLGEQLV